MNFSKLLALLLALVMLLSIVACDKPSNNEGNQTTDETTADNNETTAGKEETTAKEETTTTGADDTTTGAEDTTTGAEDTTAGAEDTTIGTEDTTTGAEDTTTGADDTTTGADDTTTEEETTVGEEIKIITIAEALELCGEPGNVTEDRYYIRATIKTISNAEYGSMVIYDATGEIEVYGTYSADGILRYSELDEKPYKGDEVLLYCILQNYNGTKEVKNARLIEFVSNQGNADVSEYTSATIAEARDAAEGAKLKVSGIVARITYANGMKPNGFILVNGADSIYVYDGDAAARVAIGNKVEIAASKTYWILDSEQNNAAVHGYKGCNQLEGVTLISNDEGNNEWISNSLPTATVKELMDNPVTNDITTQVYKVTALVKKAPGNGFVNYYIDDLDEKTGSYTYTQCNGSDFGWLDEFDGKICTVYLVVLNAKSSAAGCVYRFLPVAVIYENYSFNKDNTAEFAVKYHGIDQFEAKYTGNPALELVTSVSSELLGFENATLTYTSSDESVIQFTTADGKTTMNCLASGTATITIKGAWDGKEYSETVTVTVDIPTEEIPSITVDEAIDAELGTEVTVKGIVASSVANQPAGFYLIDESGVIAVRTDAETIAKLHVGDEIIIKGTRALSKDTDGQICIDNAELIINYYGNHAYSTNSFITGKTLADVMALNGDVSHTTEVYVITATVSRVSGGYSTNTYVVDGDLEFMLYAGSAGQYAWLESYVGQTLTIELAVCDWNNKGNKGCILSVTTADGTQIFNEVNFSN
ncbi:MAG: hypothetical protein IJV87_00135 [Clostridia bacterium]|nr:hypothetical protein [Clostridia bacterium]